MKRRWLVVAEHRGMFDGLLPPHKPRETFTYHRFRWQALLNVEAWRRVNTYMITLSVTSARIVGRVTEKRV